MRVLAVFIFILVSAQLGFAFDFTVEQAATIPLGASEKLTIDISNPTNASDTFNIAVSGKKPWMTLSPTMVTANASSSATANLYITTTPETPTGLYILNIGVESINTGEKVTKESYISVIKGEITKIEDVIIRGDFEPKGNVTLEVNIKNYALTTVNNLVLNATVRSTRIIYDLSDVIEKIDPNQTVTITRYFSLPEYSEPGRYRIELSLFYENRVSRAEEDFNVIEKAIMEEEAEDMFMIFGSGKKITVRNYGNAAGSTEITKTVSPFESFFFSGEPDVIENDTYKWIVTLEPGQEAIVEYKTDFLLLFIAFVAIAVAAWFFFFKVRTVTVKKHIIQKKKIEEGEEFTVGLDVKNSTGTSLSNVIIKDLIPPVFSAKDTVGPKPAKKVAKIGTELTWKIDTLVPGEERILTYKIIPMFGVGGQARLPKAIARFKLKEKMIQNNSNVAMLGTRAKEE
jgi:hypothetical protein